MKFTYRVSEAIVYGICAMLVMPCQGAIQNPFDYDVSFDQARDFDLTYIEQLQQQLHMEPRQSVAIEKYVPTNMHPTSRSEVVAERIIRKSLDTMLKNSSFQDSKIVQATRNIDQLKTGISFNREKGKLQHEFNFEVRALDGTATLQYSGVVKASYNYNIETQVAQFEVNQKLGESTDLIVHHIENNLGQTDRVSVRWTF